MQHFATALKSFECAEGDEIMRDLRGHIEEAQAMGKPLDAVLTSIGPAEALARAYAIELELNPRGARFRRTAGGVLRVVGILAAASIVSLLVVGALGSIGLGLTVSGLGLIVIGALEAAGVHLPDVQLAGLSPWIVIAIGPVMGVIGLAAFVGLWIYLRALARTLRRELPPPIGTR
jgi:uncharacterized membrane protein